MDKKEKSNLEAQVHESGSTSTDSDVQTQNMGPPSFSAAKSMQNPLVLSLVAKNIPTLELMVLRETSKLWNHTFLPEIRPQHPVIELKAGLKLQEWECRQRILLQNAADLMRSSLEIPCPRFRTFDPTGAGYHDFQDFFLEFGTSITCLELDLNSTIFGDPGPLDKIGQIVLELIPELSQLSLRTLSANSLSSIGTQKVQSRSNLAKQLPKLRKLELRLIPRNGINPDYNELIAEILSCAAALEHIMLNGNLTKYLPVVTAMRDVMPHVDRIDILKMDELGIPELRILIEMAQRNRNTLRLQRLNASIRYMSQGRAEIVQLLHTFLVTQSPTLKVFGIQVAKFATYEDARTFLVLQVPRMARVHSFRLVRKAMRPFKVEYEGGTLANCFPSLTRFEYNIDCQNDLNECDVRADDTNKLRHTGVTSLEVDVPLDYGFERLATLGTLFPSVIHMELQLYNPTDSFTRIWTIWPALDTLRVRYRQHSEEQLDLDELLSGIPKSNFSLLRKELEKGPLTLDKIRQLLAEYKTAPGLSDLAHLRRIAFILEDKSFTLSDIGGYFGFAMASPNLQQIVIDRTKRSIEHDRMFGSSSCCVISSECRDTIKSAFHPYTVLKL